MARYPNLVSEFDNNGNNNYKNKKKDYSSTNPLIQRCSNCGSNRIITDIESGEIICSNCGQVISNNTIEDNRPESRVFSSDGQTNKSRTGIPISLARHDMGLATVIGTPDRDASGHKIDAAMRSMMERLRTWDVRTQTHSSTDRNLRHAFYELDRLKDKLGLSDAIVEKTAYIYRKAQERMLIRGRTISGILAAAIYIACRELGTPRTLKDIAADSNVKLKEVARSYRLLYFELDLKTPLIDPMKCIVKVANKSKLSEKTKRQAAEIMAIVNKREISAGKDPMGLAASVLYLASLKNGESITQTDIADAAGVTEVTIRNRAKDLRYKFLN
ncbi:MAG TPA: TFIIB-type zinc ribbon-containing protein [Nitrososphaeraceae archaeon]|nr:TFIIB-type zinc ribbon-containing protein [Nitrososphaeraceae archaeon]